MRKGKHRSLMTIAGRDVLDDTWLSAHYIISIAGKKTSSASRLLRKLYGIGVVEWRLIAGLAREPDIAANQLSKYTLTDKGQVSKALKSLEKKGMIEPVPSKKVLLRKKMRLTEKGYHIHDAHLPWVVERENAALKGIDESEIEQFFKTLKRISKNLDRYITKTNE
ncbi:MAG: winged helix-turn-helix transcriptional regulator [SAR324 cluster bacterium]|nr:winged helix-turn-helix transcriptional regulator [SAR324 cluster bacterium]